MVRIALLALMALALDLAWWIMPEPGAALSWPRVARLGRCSLTLHEPRRDPTADELGAHTLRLAFTCGVRGSGARGTSGPATRVLHGTAVVIGDPQVDRGAYGLSGARVALIAFPTVNDPDSADARECRIALEAVLSGSALVDGDPGFRPAPAMETVLAGADSRVYALRGGAWWREETDGSWSRLADRGSAAARRDPRLAPLERTMTERQLRDGR